MILAGASCDDIYVIVLFSTFSTMAQGGSAHVKDFINIPVSIVLGIVLGSVTGYLLSLFRDGLRTQPYGAEQYEGDRGNGRIFPTDVY